MISNALKFTFRGGNIQVDAVFVPGARVSSPTNDEASLLTRERRRQVMSVGYTVLHHLFGFGPVTEGSIDINPHINTSLLLLPLVFIDACLS